jgi:hypothetical protein
LRYVTAAVGLVTVVVTMPAIVAAARNTEIQQMVYFLGIESDERCRELRRTLPGIARAYEGSKQAG